MIEFPNAKINLGLRVLHKRPDGYHDIESIFLPVPWCDNLEIIQNKSTDKITWKNYGLNIHGNPNDNLISKAYNLLDKDFSLPPVNINLLKQIPMGAGMGGGSSNAAFALKAFNNIFNLSLNDAQLMQCASQLGADCSFFIQNKPAAVHGIGDKISIIDFKWPCNYIYIVYPPYHINTADAYKNMIPKDIYDTTLIELIKQPIQIWKDTIFNDFENYAFSIYPEILALKNKIYNSGALYASMTGSGSAVYGFFDNKEHIDLPKNYNCKWLEIKPAKGRR